MKAKRQQEQIQPVERGNMMDFIPYGRQEISDEDIQAVVDVLRSSHLTQGRRCQYLNHRWQDGWDQTSR